MLTTGSGAGTVNMSVANVSVTDGVFCPAGYERGLDDGFFCKPCMANYYQPYGSVYGEQCEECNWKNANTDEVNCDGQATELPTPRKGHWRNVKDAAEISELWNFKKFGVHSCSWTSHDVCLGRSWGMCRFTALLCFWFLPACRLAP